jgi:hypothetical protein
VVPGEAFIAVTSIEGNEPRFLAGFSFLGRKTDVETLLAEPRAEMKSAFPAGKSDVVLQGKTEIETFTHGDTTIGETFREGWYLVSNDMELLRRTIDAAGEGLGTKALGANDLYRKSTARLPADGEMVLFAQVGSLTERLISLLVASGQAPDPKQVSELKKIQAIAWGTKFEDALMRDTLFILSPGNAVEPPLAQSALALSSPDTFLTYAAALPAKVELSDSSLALAALVPNFGALQKSLADKGLKLNDFSKAFGPEFGTLANWTKDIPQPSALLTMDVRDAATAKGFVEAFTGGIGGSAAWGHEDRDGVAFYQSPPAQGLVSVTPTLALTDHYLVMGFSQPDVLGGLAQIKTGKAAIAANPGFAQASKQVGTPTSGFGYLDLKTLVERSYGTMRPVLAMSLAFAPDSAKYIDAGKLPSTEAISKHLSPTVYSQSVSTDGTLIESVGPLTFNQVFGVTVGGAIAAAFPMIENALSGGLKLDPSLLQMAPPAAVPPAKTPPPADQKPDGADPAPPPEKPAGPPQ